MHEQLSVNFNSREFDSKDLPGSGINMSSDLITRLQAMRSYLGMPIVIKSGFRTVAHNRRVGGKATSAHLTGQAVDITCIGSNERFHILQAAFYAGFDRIGVQNSFIHLDVSSTLPQGVLWLYDTR